MRALASPASLKGVLSAVEAAAALASGMRSVGGVEVDEVPVADGGEGTAETLQRSLGGAWRTAVVGDAFGRPVEARFLLLPDGTAVVESAEAVGITRLRAEELDPLRASSAGLGELLLAVLATRPKALLVYVGGTATVDGGAGLRRVVGTALRGVPVRVACDVRNPLLGERGAARVFGPPEGATPEGARGPRGGGAAGRRGGGGRRGARRRAPARARGRAAGRPRRGGGARAAPAAGAALRRRRGGGGGRRALGGCAWGYARGRAVSRA